MTLGLRSLGTKEFGRIRQGKDEVRGDVRRPGIPPPGMSVTPLPSTFLARLPRNATLDRSPSSPCRPSVHSNHSRQKSAGFGTDPRALHRSTSDCPPSRECAVVRVWPVGAWSSGVWPWGVVVLDATSDCNHTAPCTAVSWRRALWGTHCTRRRNTVVFAGNEY